MVQLFPLYGWAILPEKQRIDRAAPRSTEELLARNFRYHRQFRYREACPPWVLAAELGWIISSPVDITLDCLDDVQVGLAEEQMTQDTGSLMGKDLFWQRGEGYIALTGADWIRSYQYRRDDGKWEAMFVPNGQGTVEWRLGWAASIPDEYFILVGSLNDGTDGLSVPSGILTARQVNRTRANGGFSIAVQPVARVSIRRGQPIARLVLLSRESINAVIEAKAIGQQ